MSWACTALALLGWAAAGQPAHSASPLILYVSSSHPNATDAGPGTSPDAPLRSVARASLLSVAMGPGDAVLLRRGDVFRGPLRVAGRGTPARPILIAAYDEARAARPTVIGGGSGDDASAITVADASWAAVEGIEATDAVFGVRLEWGPGARPDPANHSVTGFAVRDCVFLRIRGTVGDNSSSWWWGAAVVVGKTHGQPTVGGLVIENSVVNDSDTFFRNGWGAQTASRPLVSVPLVDGAVRSVTTAHASFNTMMLVRADGVGVRSSLFFRDAPAPKNLYLHGTTDITLSQDRRVTIAGNEFVWRGEGMGQHDGCGIDFERCANDTTIRGNYFYHTHAAGVMVFGNPADHAPISQRTTVSSNVFVEAGCGQHRGDYGALALLSAGSTGSIRGNTFVSCPNGVPDVTYKTGARTGWHMSGTVHRTACEVVALPTISMVGALVNATCATKDTQLRYTLDGSVPHAGSPVLSGGGVVLARTAAVNVKGFHDTMLCSPTASLLVVVGANQAKAPVVNSVRKLKSDDTRGSRGFDQQHQSRRVRHTYLDNNF
eukprot:COSAG01_NODE_2611_length_7384_cov_7.141386_3_plen_547_part_00